MKSANQRIRRATKGGNELLIDGQHTRNLPLSKRVAAKGVNSFIEFHDVTEIGAEYVKEEASVDLL
jgi:hypothetical protein